MSLTAISISRLQTCDPQLVRLFTEVSRRIPIFILCGHRNEADQNKAFAEKTSKAKWGESKHNSWPSKAVDAGPKPLRWDDLEAFRQVAKVVKEVAAEMGIRIRWGGDFKDFFDAPHYELAE